MKRCAQTPDLRISRAKLLVWVSLYLIFTLQFLTSISFSQQPTQEWVARFPGPSNDLYGPFMEVDKHGNSYITGTHVVNDTPKVVCAKYNTDGVLLWSTLYVYPVEAYIRPSGMALDSSGNVFVIADQGPAYFLPTNGLIMKFNNVNGSVAWVKRYIGQYGWGAFRDIKIDRQNNIYVAGWTDSSHLVIRYNGGGDSVWVRKYRPPWGVRETIRACTLDDSLNIIITGTRTFYYISNYDSLLVAKYSPGGVLRWESVYANNFLSPHVGTKAAADQLGNIYIGGETSVSGDGVYLTMKYDRNGTRQWARIYDASGSGSSTLKAMAMDRTNNALYVTGAAIFNGKGVAATIKYNSNTGDTVWVKLDSGSYSRASSRQIILDSNGNVYITGETYNFPSYVPYDILTIKYSQIGGELWRITFNGNFNGLDIGRIIGLDASNNVYVLGTSQSNAQVTDYIVIKYSQLTGIGPISYVFPKQFKLLQNYPNPFNPVTKIQFIIPKISFVRLQIYDILGRLIETTVEKQLSPSVYEVTFDGSKYTSGLYFYQLIADNSIIDTKKFIIIK